MSRRDVMAWFSRGASQSGDSRNLDRREVIHLLTGFVADVRPADTGSVDPCTPLFSGGHLSSLALVQLVLFVETTFGLNLSEVVDVAPANLDTIDQIADVVCGGCSA
jgi:acyl carrier protein